MENSELSTWLPNGRFVDSSADFRERNKSRIQFFKQSVRRVNRISVDRGCDLYTVHFYSDFKHTSSIVMPLYHSHFASGKEYVPFVFAETEQDIKEASELFFSDVLKKCLPSLGDQSYTLCFAWAVKEQRVYGGYLYMDGDHDFHATVVGEPECLIDFTPLSSVFGEVNPRIRFIPNRGDVMRVLGHPMFFVLSVDLEAGKIHLIDDECEVISMSLFHAQRWLTHLKPLREKITIHELQALAGNMDVYERHISAKRGYCFKTYRDWKSKMLKRYREGGDVDRHLREYSRNYRERC